MTRIRALTRPILQRFRRFAREPHATASVELVIVLPLLLWALAATVVFFDGYKARYQAEMAAQTVADILSRETELFTAPYVEGLNSVFDFLADARFPTRIRVSSVIWDSTNQRHRLQWSYGTRGLAALPANTFELMQNDDLATLQGLFGNDQSFAFTAATAQMPIPDLPERIPPILPGEAMLLVETFALWSPFASVGVGQLRFAPVVAVRPRFAPWINFQGATPIYPESDYEVAWAGGGNDSLPDPNQPQPTPAPVNPARTFTFDDGVTTGWSRATTTSGGPTGTFLGIFGNETYANPVTLAIDLGQSGTNASIAFDLILTDSWDGYSPQYAQPRGDNLTLLIDGTPISLDVFSGGSGSVPYRNARASSVYLNGTTYQVAMALQGAPSGTNFIGASWSDHIWRVTVSITNAPRNVSLGFSAGTDSASNDEGFGIDNLSVSASGTGAAAPFLANPAALTSPDPHTRFPRYAGCPEHRIATNWLTLKAADLTTGITFTRATGSGTNLQTCPNNGGGWGWVSASPHLVLNYEAPASNRPALRLRMNDGNNGYTCDTTLLVRDPQGQFWFNDDLNGWNSGLTINSAVSGQYTIFIGSYNNQSCESALTIN